MGGLREAEAHTRKYALYIIFSENTSHTFMGCSLLTHNNQLMAIIDMIAIGIKMGGVSQNYSRIMCRMLPGVI
jgi:hypothetical protein